MPFTTLYYANGPNWNVTWNGTHAVREDLAGVDTTAWEYQQPAGIRMAEETHGGEDVAIYASGQSPRQAVPPAAHSRLIRWIVGCGHQSRCML